MLPRDGVVNYYGPIMSRALADGYFDSLMCDIAWENDKTFVYGNTITTRRKVGFYADEPFSYIYSRTKKTALPWKPVLLELKSLVEKESGERFNSCLLNLYHDGTEGMGWHSDAEKELKPNAAIGSLSFGASRDFAFKHKQTKTLVAQLLEHGSLLMMKGATQRYWLHSVPPRKRVCVPRINLTFRTMQWDSGMALY